MNIANTNECKEAQSVVLDPIRVKNFALVHACGKGNLPFVEQLLQDPNVDPTAYDNSAIAFACYFGRLAIVRRLLKDSRMDPSAQDNYAIRSACNGGHADIVKLLLQDPRVDSTIQHNISFFEMACRLGHTATVGVLLSDHLVDPSAQRNRALWFACDNGHIETVKLLLQDERVARTHAKDNCLRAAAFAGHAHIVELMLPTAGLTKKECVKLIYEMIKHREMRGEFEAVKSLLAEHLNKLTQPQRSAAGKRRASEVVIDNHDASLRKAPKLYKPTTEPKYCQVEGCRRLQDCSLLLCCNKCRSNVVQGLFRKPKSAEKRREKVELRNAASKRLREDEQQGEPSGTQAPKSKRTKQ
jgi:hypothetical protein